MEMKGVRLRTEELEPGSSFTSRDLGIEAMDDRLLHHCIYTDPDVAGPAPGEPCVGRSDPWAKPEAIVEPLPLPTRSRRDDHRRGSRIKHKVSVAKPASSAVLFSDLPPKWVTRPVSPSVLSNGIGITSG